MITLYLPRLNRAGLKSRLPTVCLAAMGIRYEKLVAIVAVAVIAENALSKIKYSDQYLQHPLILYAAVTL